MSILKRNALWISMLRVAAWATEFRGSEFRAHYRPELRTLNCGMGQSAWCVCVRARGRVCVCVRPKVSRSR